ncbi:MgtC/SapB family protein [Halothiobacillus sp. DCM-1]|uniref:MgtC/SapB family protein n=1 Tax=Halothiobacillus sp. DCM-1 TaxID=3112558 RepID=UPI00324380E8
MPALHTISPELLAFVATALFGFVIGLEWHQYRRSKGHSLGFGTTRTFTLIAIFGLALMLVDPSGRAYGIGLAILGLWLALDYWRRLQAHDDRLFGAVLALIVYAFGPLVLHGPLWLPILFVITTLILLGEKPVIRRFSDALRHDEAMTLAKFLIMAGVILPLLPDQPIAPFLAISWYQVWLAVIVVSGISYFSYLAQTYFFPNRGTILTGILGGLYSSTAVTVVLGKRAKSLAPSAVRPLAAATVLATLMMYLRLLALIATLGHTQSALHLLLPFGLLIVASAMIAGWLLWHNPASPTSNSQATEAPPHPLEFSTALLFAFLFVLFATLTHFVVQSYGSQGLHLLAFMVGFSDIDPFILSLLDGKLQLSEHALESAILIASGSNNLLKAAYALLLSRNRGMMLAAGWLTLSFGLSLGYVFLS